MVFPPKLKPIFSIKTSSLTSIECIRTVGEIGARYVILKYGTRTVGLELAQTVGANAESPPPADMPSADAVKHGPVKHTRSLARGDE
jgi:hypothetical protein